MAHALIVENDAMLRDFTAALFAALGWTAEPVDGSKDALALLASGKTFDLLFSDVRLRDADECLHLVRQARALYPDLPILLTSGGERPAVMPAAGVDFLPKPFRRNTLDAALRRLLGGY